MRAPMLIVLLALAVALQAAVPLAAYYPMEPDPAAPEKLVDAGPLGYHGTVTGATVVDGHVGKALHFDHAGKAVIDARGMLDKLSDAMTLTFWVKIDAFPTHDHVTYLVKKRPTFSFGIGDNRLLAFDAYKGSDWYTGDWCGKVPVGTWTHLAFTLKKGGQRIIYQDGKAVGTIPAPMALWPTPDALILGEGDWSGALDEVRLYGAALTPDEIAQDMAGTLVTRAMTDADVPPVMFPATLRLARYDMPVGFSNGLAHTRQTAQRVPGPDATDWPTLTLNGAPLFKDKPEQVVELPMRNGGLFQEKDDAVIAPGNHWFRPQPWRWNQQNVYTTDPSARGEGMQYELWAFPLRIAAGAADVAEVTVAAAGTTLYHATGPWHSLTLLLPQYDAYDITVNGRGPVRCAVGLAPVTPGAPVETPLRVNAKVPGTTLTLTTPEHPDVFPNPAAWDADVKALAAPVPALPAAGTPAHLGLDVPRSPLTINAMGMGGGMASGFYYQDRVPVTPEQFADYLADMGFDRDFEQTSANSLGSPDDPRSYEHFAQALAARGVGLGLVPDNSWKRPFLSHPNMPFFSYSLPDWHAPLFRDVQLTLQRLGRFGNLAGISIGADNAGYVPYWDWAPPIPNRPWGEAFAVFQGARPLVTPRPPVDGGKARDFVDYLARYDDTFRQYAYIGRAVAEVNPAYVATTGSFGSSPGVGGRGGWPWASIPGEPMHEGLSVQQAYDWNEMGASKPMHLVALVDRLRSYNPDKPTWAVVDDFSLFFGREARQRAYALVLTRGVQAVGTTWLPAPPTQPNPRPLYDRPDVRAEQKELFAWVHRYGGVYAITKPVVSVGILYVHPQALMRRIAGPGASPEKEYAGSHEGKVTEALFLCHAAGLPARVVTPEELKRGLPLDMRALLLVGLNKFDDTWAWSDGLTDALKGFTAQGGRLLLDDESVAPVPAEKTGLHVLAYITQGDTDATPLLLARNAENITKLRAALKDLPAPVATSDDPTIWALPTRAGDVQYVTVVNQGSVDGKNASKVVKPQTGKLAWHTTRPIYDVRLRRRLTPEEAATCDLTADAFRWYALPPAEVVAPTVKVSVQDGWYTAVVTVGNPTPMSGIPVELTVKNDRVDMTVYGATGHDIRLPIHWGHDAGTYQLTVTELLSGLQATTKVEAPLLDFAPEPKPAVIVNQPAAVATFATRKAPLVIALTDAQAGDKAIAVLADTLAAYYRGKGRTVSIRRAVPNDVVLGLQPLTATQHYPQWKTISADLILLGAPADNVLLLDQTRAYLLPAIEKPTVAYTHSPFVGEYDALNLLAKDAEGLAQAVEAVVKGR